MVGNTPDQYIEVAARLAADSDRLVHLRRNLRKMSLEYGLGDSKRFAHKLEDAFTQMLDKLKA